MIDIEIVRQLCDEEKMIWTIHIVRKLQERGIYREGVIEAINNGQIIEQYPNDYPHPSCLISGKDRNNVPLHAVIGYDGKMLYMITAYTPDNVHFVNNYNKRKENE